MTNNTTYISTGAFKTHYLQEIFDLCQENGFRGIELGSGFLYADDFLSEIGKAARQPLKFLVHNYFPPPAESFVLNLASNEPLGLDRSLKHCYQAVEMCAEIKTPFYSVHSGFAFHAAPEQMGGILAQVPRFSMEVAQRNFIKSIKQLCAYAQRKDISILIENNVLAPKNLVEGENHLLLGVTADDLLSIYRSVDCSNLGFLIDMAHLKISAQTLGFDADEFLAAVAPYVKALHLSDNDGEEDSHLPFDKTAWFLPRLRQFPGATLVFESYNLDIPHIHECIDIIDHYRN